MEEESQSGSPVGIISAVAVFILPLLYVLSVGPAAMISERFNVPSGVEKALELFYLPLAWLYANTALQEPLNLYIDWWIQ